MERPSPSWRESVPPGVRLAVADPPYERATPLAGALAPVRGRVLLWELEAPALSDVPRLTRALAELRAELALPAVLRTPMPHSPESLLLLSRARAIGFDAVLLPDQPLARALTTFLADPADLPGAWLRWVDAHREIPNRLWSELETVLARAPHVACIRSLYPELEVAPRTLRHALLRAGLPKLERWYDGARLLHADLALQRDPALSVERMAAELGYADGYSYASRAYRLFGITPAASRKLLGLEWRFEAWWRRSRRTAVPACRPQLAALT